MKNTILSILFLLVAGLQTAWAQKVVLYMDDKQSFEYDVQHLDSIVFVEAANPTPDPGDHAWVDLGLPSGTLWATCNVGANSPEEYGDYFAWGETEPKSNYSWSTYKYCKGSYTTLTKYCASSDYGYNGFTDTLTELLPEDDAATANWGSDWQMPSLEQLLELYNSEYTTTTWTTQNVRSGKLVTSKSNGKSIFLPAAGFCYDTSLDGTGSHGLYWSRSLGENFSGFAGDLWFYSTYVRFYGNYRYYGRSVRPVRVKY